MVRRGLIRAAMRRWVWGWIMRSLVETWYQVGLCFHAGSVTAFPNVDPIGAF